MPMTPARIPVIIIIALFLRLASSAHAHQQQQGFRLPPNFRPAFYDVRIAVDEPSASAVTESTPKSSTPPTTFRGSAQITVNCVKATEKMIIHASNLTIRSEDVIVRDSSSGLTLDVKGVQTMEQFELLVIKMNPGQGFVSGSSYVIDLRFGGRVSNISEDFGGLQSAVFRDVDGVLRYHLRTQFQPTGARRVFPCFDEPEFKSIFQLSIARKATEKSYSNMPLKQSTPMKSRPGWMWDEFLPSTKMSTYVVAFAIGEFTAIPVESAAKNADGYAIDDEEFAKNVPQNLIVRSSYVQSAANNYTDSLEIISKILSECEKLLGLPYFLPKLDHIGIAQQRSGMENYGLITYGEEILVLPEPDDEVWKQFSLEMIVHEDVHMWFGNLVTMRWWDDIWMNEGLTTFFSALVIDQALPEERSLETLVAHRVNRAIGYDYDIDAMAMAETVDTFEDVSLTSIFSRPSRVYHRGAAVINMVYNFMGHNCFISAMQDYLKMFAFSTVTEQDLWTTLENKQHEECSEQLKVPGRIPIADTMYNWTHLPGVPVLTVTRDYENKGAYVKQERFLSWEKTADLRTNASNVPMWSIPITYTTKKEKNFNITQPKMWMINEIESIKTFEEEPEETDWIIFNIQRSGYYLVNYDLDNWAAILGQLNEDPSAIHPLNRAQIISDSLMLCHAGLLIPIVCSAIVEYLRTETHYAPWAAAAAHIHIMRGLRQSDCDFKEFAEQLGSSASALIMQEQKRSGGFLASGNKVRQTDKESRRVLGLLQDWMQHVAKKPGEAYITEEEKLWMKAVGVSDIRFAPALRRRRR